MPSVQRFLHALRALLEDERHQGRKRPREHDSTSRNNNRTRQAVSLVITFRDLFANGGLNLILEDMDGNRKPSKKYKTSTPATPRADHSTTVSVTGTTKVLKVENPRPAGGESVLALTPLDEEITPLLIEGNLPSAIDQSSSTFPVPMPLIPINERETFSFMDRWNREQTNFTVALNPDDEKKTVNALRKVLKWSPRKRNLASFAVTLPREEEHKAVAVVQNAVNRVKEEQQSKKKRRFLRLVFC